MNNFIKQAMDLDSSLIDSILSSNTMGNLSRLGDLSDSVNLGDFHNIIGDASNLPSGIGALDNLEFILKNSDSIKMPDANDISRFLQMAKKENIAGHIDTDKFIEAVTKNFARKSLEQEAFGPIADNMTSLGHNIFKNIGSGDIIRSSTTKALGPGNSEGLRAFREYTANNSLTKKILKSLFGIGAIGTGATALGMGIHKNRKAQEAVGMEMKNMAKQIADLQLSNQALQKSNQALQTSNSSLTANFSNRLKNMGQSIMDVVKNNPKTSIALGAGAAGLASLPLLMGSYENPIPKKKTVKKRKSVKTSELIMDMAREKVAAFDWNNPMLVAGVGGLTGAAAGATEQYLFNPPEERNYTGALINGGAGGAIGALAGKGAGFGGDLPSTLLHGGIFGGTLGLYTPDRTDMKFMTQRELQDMQRYLDSPDADPEMVPYVQAYMADQRREYGL